MCFTLCTEVELLLRISKHFSLVARDFPQIFQFLTLETAVKTFCKKKCVRLQLLNFRKQLLFLVSLFSSSLVRAHMFFPLFCLSASSQILNAHVQYMVKSYISNADKNSGLNLSGLGLKTAMITATLCSTPSRTKTTYWLILCEKGSKFFF